MRMRKILGAGSIVVLALTAMNARAQVDNVQMLADRWVEAYNTHDREALGNL